MSVFNWFIFYVCFPALSPSVRSPLQSPGSQGGSPFHRPTWEDPFHKSPTLESSPTGPFSPTGPPPRQGVAAQTHETTYGFPSPGPSKNDNYSVAHTVGPRSRVHQPSFDPFVHGPPQGQPPLTIDDPYSKPHLTHGIYSHHHAGMESSLL